MSDSDNTPAPPEQQTQTTPSSNANTTMLVAMGCILLLGLAAVLIFKKKDTSSEDELNALKEEKRQRELALGTSSDPLASAAEVEARLKTIRDNANQLQSGFDKLRNDLATTTNSLKQAHTNNQTQQNLIASYSAQINGLKQQINQLQALSGNATAYQQRAQQLQNELAQANQLIAQLKARPSKESLDLAESSLQTANATKAQLGDEIERLKLKMLDMVSSDKVADLQRLKTDNESLRQQLQTLRTKLDFAKLYIKAYDQLPAKAAALFKELQTLEGKTEGEINLAYTRILTQLKAENMRQVKFATGSSLVNFTDQANIRNELMATNNKDYFLVVGYASKTGDAASNEELSANRATTVASIVNQLKKEGQDVRAVYLGQTDRFSKSKAADNQLCEIWRIKE